MASVVDLRYMLEDHCLSACPSPHSSVREANHCGVLVSSVVPRWGLQQYYKDKLAIAIRSLKDRSVTIVSLTQVLV